MDERLDRRTRKRQRTRLAIQDAAFGLFAERGYRETTINAIADRADVAPRTVTVHFPTKEELLFDAEPYTLESLTAALHGRTPHESALDALRAWMASTTAALDSAESGGQVWERRRLRAHIINAEPELPRPRPRGLPRIRTRPRRCNRARPRPARHRARPSTRRAHGHHRTARLYETEEARVLSSPPKAAELLDLVDRVIAFTRAGIEGSTAPPKKRRTSPAPLTSRGSKRDQ